ncbi:Transcriptional repressor AdcR [Streptococcus parasanguinis]|uniref:zinc-dependent MarR family transcriptional regulator n=1 Tax=Streptococcus parasanguinis TaxID=1318 RepID=UPI000F767DB1|nr:zinc-dependent MarR family transcriptional regulator [Streptococcus parasanguinis]MCP8990014.1 zinc-dependent MarR family transcriptional regulator [Streptococcus parasanguinis]MCP8992405.1 zinc-dependent MarR family transcriptional regulator [Streptococcus parasanguinis]MCP9002749.1 zinc-dependent MarR family transcriptional regulator [Streptococcus parasanguinis]MCP9009063.1 zinc-dependent MarR family transcriptional regulator [Streptococcus parasanguinis]MCP9033985.1 zinc-dependent MarR 
MSEVANKIDRFLNSILLLSEDQHEILVGSCTSGVSLTNTQEHILMLVADEALTNSVLAKKLNVSQAAITKAVKPLLSQGMLETYRDENDARVLYYRLTDIGKPIALEHQHHHQHTLHTYEDVLSKFTKNEQGVISRFLDLLEEEL